MIVAAGDATAGGDALIQGLAAAGPAPYPVEPCHGRLIESFQYQAV